MSYEDTELHPYEAGGFGPGPYEQTEVIEDSSLGLTCDLCGQKHLRTKFMLVSSTGTKFGVGSECIKKHDAELWLETKHHFGAGVNITPKQIEKRGLYNECQGLIDKLNKINPLYDSIPYNIKWISSDFASISSKHKVSFENAVQSLKDKIERQNELTELFKQVKIAFLAAARARKLPASFSDSRLFIGLTCAENSNPRRKLQQRGYCNSYKLVDALSYLKGLTN